MGIKLSGCSGNCGGARCEVRTKPPDFAAILSDHGGAADTGVRRVLGGEAADAIVHLPECVDEPSRYFS